MRSKLTFSQAIDGYVLYAESRRRSAHTLAEADTLMREYLETGHAIFYHPGGEHDLAPAVRQALPSTGCQ